MHSWYGTGTQEPGQSAQEGTGAKAVLHPQAGGEVGFYSSSTTNSSVRVRRSPAAVLIRRSTGRLCARGKQHATATPARVRRCPVKRASSEAARCSPRQRSKLGPAVDVGPSMRHSVARAVVKRSCRIAPPITTGGRHPLQSLGNYSKATPTGVNRLGDAGFLSKP